MTKRLKFLTVLCAFFAAFFLSAGVVMSSPVLAASIFPDYQEDPFGDPVVYQPKFVMDEGASIRVDDGNSGYGVKFTAKMSNNDYGILTEKLDGGEYSSVSFGMLIAPASYAEKYGALDYENVFSENAVYNWRTFDTENGGWNDYVEEEGKTQIINIYGQKLYEVTPVEGNVYWEFRGGSVTQVSSVLLEYQGIGYVEIVNADGSVEYIFATPNDNVRSAYDVAVKALADPNSDLSDTEKAWIEENYVKPGQIADVYGVKTASNLPEGHTVDLGDEIVYKIALTNVGNGNGTVTVTDEVPENTTFVSGCDNVEGNKLSWTVEVPANSTATVSYTVKVNDDAAIYDKYTYGRAAIVADKAMVGDRAVEAHTTYVSKTWGATDISFIKTAIKSYKSQEYFEGADLLRRIFYTAFSQAVSMGKVVGTDSLDSRKSIVHYYTAADMLDLVFEDSTDTNATLYKAMVAPSLFGGAGVSADILASFAGTPISDLTTKNLIGGDVVLIEDTADAEDGGCIYIYDGQDLHLITDQITKVNAEEVLASAVGANRFAVLRISVGLPYVHKAQARVTDAELTEAQRAIIATAEAFLLRGPRLQYNDVDAPYRSQAIQTHAPEDCTSTEWQYTNCAMFTYDCYYFGLDYSLGGSNPKYSTDRQLDLTGAVRPFFYEVTGSESEEEKEQIKQQFLSTLQPGDIIVYRYTTSSGHSMLYVGNGTIIHSSGSNFSSYNSDSKSGYETYESSIRYMQALEFFDGPEGSRRLVFGGGIAKFGIIRPLAIRNDNTASETSRNRMENLKGISIEKVASQSSTVTVNKGGNITYTFNIYNSNDVAKTLNITDVVPENTTFVSGCDNVSGNNLSWTVSVPADEIISISYTVKVNDDVADGTIIVAEDAVAGGVPVRCHKIYVGNTLTAEQQELLKTKALELIGDSTVTERGAALINRMYKEALGVESALPYTSDAEIKAALFVNPCASSSTTLIADGEMIKYIAPTMYYGRRTYTMDGSTTARVELWGGDRAVLGRSCHLVVGDIVVKVNSSSNIYYLYLGGETFYRVSSSYFGNQYDVTRYFEYVYAAAYHGVVLRPSLGYAS